MVPVDLQLEHQLGNLLTLLNLHQVMLVVAAMVEQMTMQTAAQAADQAEVGSDANPMTGTK